MKKLIIILLLCSPLYAGPLDAFVSPFLEVEGDVVGTDSEKGAFLLVTASNSYYFCFSEKIPEIGETILLRGTLTGDNIRVRLTPSGRVIKDCKEVTDSIWILIEKGTYGTFPTW